MGLEGRDIICLSTHYWDERRFRKQEFMSRFARANRVLFVEPTFSMARGPEAHLREVATNRVFAGAVEQREPGLHLMKPPRGLPKWTDPRVERVSYAWHGRAIGRAARRLGFRDPILWIYRPAYVHALDAIPHGQLVFDLVDDLAAYGGDADPLAVHVEGCVNRLIDRSDLLVVTAKTLYDRYADRARRIEQVANGFNAELFSPDRARELERPRELDGIPGPILGFIGTLFPFLDFDLFEQIARVHSDKSMVLVGPVEASATESVERLKRHPNVFHVGAQPQSEVPRFVAAFDVCLNTFRRTRVSDSVNPLKVYEYLAMGKPVVSTPMEALRREDAGRVVAFADGADEFCAQIDRCLAEPDPAAAARDRSAAAAPYSWDRLFDRLDEACEAALAAPQPSLTGAPEPSA